MLLRKKVHLLNSHILDLMFIMAGTIDPAGKEVTGVPNISAFRDVLCDLELWCGADTSPDLAKSLLDHFYDLLADSGMQRTRTLRDFSLVEKLLSVLRRTHTASPISGILLRVVRSLLSTNPRVTDVLCFALFCAATLHPAAANESTLGLNRDGTDFEEGRREEAKREVADCVVLRNRCLQLFYSLLHAGKKVHAKYCEDVVQVVGFDWVLLFAQTHLHSSTVVWGLRILMTLVSMPPLMEKFRLGNCNGHWLLKSDIVLQNKMVQALGQASSTGGKTAARRGVRQDIFAVPGESTVGGRDLFCVLMLSARLVEALL